MGDLVHLPPSNPLASLDRARQAIEAAKSLEEVKRIRDQAEAARHLVRAAKMGKEMVDQCAEIRLRAERRVGEMLPAILLQGRPSKVSCGTTLSKLGISRDQSARWQKLADIAESTFETYIEAAKISPKADISATELICQMRQAAKAERVARIVDMPVPALPEDQMFPVILADPPWRYDFAGDKTRQVENHYPTMTVDEIADVWVPAADDAVLFLWATSPKLRDAFEVLDGWQFNYRSSMVWIKDRFGNGYYARQQHELLLIATRGKLPLPDPANRPSSVIAAPRGEHSVKPPIVHDVIERMYPGFPKCELFARQTRDGWTAWGNQINRQTD